MQQHTQNPIDWEWFRKRVMATPVRRERIGGQSVSYIERESVIGLIEEATRKTPAMAKPITLGDMADFAARKAGLSGSLFKDIPLANTMDVRLDQPEPTHKRSALQKFSNFLCGRSK